MKESCLLSASGVCVIRQRVDKMITGIDSSILRKLETSERFWLLRKEGLSTPAMRDLNDVVRGSACENCTLGKVLDQPLPTVRQ